MSLFLIVALPFLGALLPGVMIQAGRRVCALVTGMATLLALIGLLAHLPALMRGEVVQARLDWVPSLGLNANFFLDPLGMLFGVLILGIGLLVIIYARYYLSREDSMGEFYTYLLLFQGAMLGIVLSDNILLLLVFWELTSLSSFLLIGFWKDTPDGRQGARMALAVTAMGGLAMIGGMLILGQIAGSYDISTILQAREAIQTSPYYLPALLLILLGCFTKSAQFPFHFWLPHAMAAPTPVSAYLHSATMVKAGLFLMARLWPVLSGTPEWFYIVATTGLVTMVIGAAIALFKDDLKALLAFSTVSHLGLITMLLGFGSGMAVVAAVFHIFNHATFKAALFMTAGIIDHEAGTRDMRRLGGLWRLMPMTFVIALITGLAMAGVPLLNGFLSKEMMLEEAAQTIWAGNHWLVPLLATLGALLSAAYAFRFIGHTFLGPERDDYPHEPHDPYPGMWLPAAFLAVIVVATGLFSGPLLEAPLRAVAAAVTGGPLPAFHLRIWHGVTPALLMSVIALLGGAIMLALYRPLDRGWRAAPIPVAKTIYDSIIGALVAAGAGLTARLHDGTLTRYAAIFTVTVLALGLYAFLSGDIGAPVRAVAWPDLVPVVGWAMLVLAATGMAVFHRQRLLALVLMAIIGLVIAVGFNYLSAPDLALTQLSVEVVTSILLLLALYFLPRTGQRDSSAQRRLRDGAIAAAGGLGAGLLVYALMLRDFTLPTISDYFVANSYTGGGGTNVVNVILVDFRGFDTFGEITVLGIAAIIIYAATEALLSGPVRARLLAWMPAQKRAGDPHPVIMTVVTRLLIPIVLMVGVYILMRGHNQPGGGFIAGLIVSVGVVMQYLANGLAWTEARQRFPYHGIIGAGILTAGLTGIGAWFAGKPFLTSAFGYVRIPPMQEFELASAMAFDLGVFLTVVGAVLLALQNFSRMARLTAGQVDEYPRDLDPLAQED